MSIQTVLSGILSHLKRQDKQIAETKRLLVHNPLNAGKASLQPIAGGAIAVTRPHVVVLPESGTADDLDEIENFSDGKFIVISTADVGDTITVRDESISGGNIALRGVTSRVLSDPEDSLLLIYKESVGFWIQAGGTPAGGVPVLHASTHQHGGTDEVATATPAANAIPKAGGGGTLAAGWIPAGLPPGAHAASHQNGGSDELLHQTLDGAGSNTHAQIDTHLADTSNPHAVTKAQVGLSNVTNDAQIPLAQKGAANGVAELDASGRVPTAQLAVAVMEYKGTWDASTNTPTLADGTGSTGDTYRVSVAGSQNLGSGAISFSVGDYVIYNGSTWEKSDTTDAVASVNGATGVVVLTTTNISEGTNLYYTDERSQDMISSFLVSGNGIGFSYDDVLNTLTILLATLTSDWDIGEDRAIQAELLKARDAEGITIQDDGANGYIHLLDGGETKLRRDSAGVLLNLGDLAITELGTLLQTGFIRTSSDNDVNFTIVRTLPTVGLMGAGVNGDTFRRFLMFANGNLEWGDGASARDTNLYRSLADTLRTDDNLIVVGKLGAGIAPAVTQIHTAVSDAVTNAITNAITMGHLSSGTPAAGFGIGFIAQLESSTTAHQDAGRLAWEWTTATHASRASKGKLSAFLGAAEVIGLTWDSVGDVIVTRKLGAGGVSPSAYIQATGAISTVYNPAIVTLIGDSLLGLANVVGAEAAGLQAFFQFSVNGGTHNRVGGIGFVAESASDRKAAIVFVTDQGSGNRTEKARISGDGNLGVGLTTPLTKIHVQQSDAVTNAIVNLLTLDHSSSGTPAPIFGLGILAQLESSTTVSQDAGRLTWEWTTATHASRASKGKLSAYLVAAEVIGLTWDSAGLVQIPGTLNAVGAVDFDSTLNVDGAATLNAGETVTQPTLGQPVQTLVGVASNDDVKEVTIPNKVTTTDATPTTLHSFAIPANNTVVIDAIVLARRTGGSAGTADDGATYQLKRSYTTKAGVVTQLGIFENIQLENVAAWDATLVISGSNVILQVTGVANTNISWEMVARFYQLGT